MIQIQFTMTKKQYKKLFVEALVIYYLKIYAATLFCGTVLLSAIGKLTDNLTFTNSAFTMMFTFIPVIIACGLIATGMALFEARKIGKNHPELLEGTFKIKFDKINMMMQINGQNHKLQYHPYRYHPGFKNSFILYQPQSGSIVIPQNVLTKEQKKTVKGYIKGI